jgi:hypothetical protein
MNYTEKETKEMIEFYNIMPDKQAIIEILANKYNKSIKSIIGKLSKEKVYIKKSYKTKTGEIPVTKVEMIFQLSQALNADAEKLQGLIKVPKPELKYLLNLIIELPKS